MQSDPWGHYEPISYAHSATGGSQVQQVVGGVGGGSASAAAAAVTNVIRSGRAVAQAAAAAAQAAGDAVGTAGSAGTAVDPRLLASAAHLSASASLTASKLGIHKQTNIHI